jgi:hypothetical protein
MKKNKGLVWGLILAIPMIISVSGCKKFLDRKPLTATLNDLNRELWRLRVLDCIAP